MMMRRWITACAVLVCFSGALGQDVEALIADLRDDDVKWNASEAMREIALMGPDALEALHAALDSDDLQQRHLACNVLWDFYEPQASWHNLPRSESVWRWQSLGTLTDRMIEVSVEGLRDDAIPRDPEGSYMWYANAARGVQRLSRHAQAARTHLEAAVESDDPQQRFLAALALARGGVSESTDLVLPVLMRHLRDNDIPEDAKYCVHAIYQLGEAARPALEETQRETNDDQQRRLVTLILLHLDGAPKDQAEVEQRRALNTIARSVHDPCLNGPGDRSMYWLGHLSD